MLLLYSKAMQLLRWSRSAVAQFHILPPLPAHGRTRTRLLFVGHRWATGLLQHRHDLPDLRMVRIRADLAMTNRDRETLCTRWAQALDLMAFWVVRPGGRFAHLHPFVLSPFGLPKTRMRRMMEGAAA